MPCVVSPYFSIASQHLTTMGGTSTSSRAICSARLTPNVGLRAAVSILRADFVFDPRGRGRRVFGLGVGLR